MSDSEIIASAIRPPEGEDTVDVNGVIVKDGVIDNSDGISARVMTFSTNGDVMKSSYLSLTLTGGTNAFVNANYALGGSSNFDTLNMMFSGQNLNIPYKNPLSAIGFVSLTVIPSDTCQFRFRITKNNTSGITLGVFNINGTKLNWTSLFGTYIINIRVDSTV